MEVRKMPRRLARAVVFVTTAAAGLAAVPMASAHAIPLRVGPAHITHIGMPGAHNPGSAGTTVTSTNWSGYAVNGGPYTSVTTSWTQPSVDCSVTPNSYAAFWAGLDGYSSSTVEQDGTLAECVGSGGRHNRTQSAQYIAWYEAYPSPMYQFGGAVVPSDKLTSTVSYAGNNAFTLMLTDTEPNGTQRWATATATVTVPGAARSSAEVIAEAPSSNRGVLPLADFGSVNFFGSAVDGATLDSGIQIDMVTNGGAAEATPGSLSGGAFSVTWDS